MRNCCYIIYSPFLDRYYIGETENLKDRLQLHNTGYFKGFWTSKVSDWEIFLEIPCKDRSQARKIEGYIKSLKSRKYIQKLRNDSGYMKRLIERFD